MTDKTPIELLMVDALKARRTAEELEAKAAAASNPQWRHYYSKQAEPQRTLETYYLDRAWEQVALFLDGKSGA